MNVVLWGQNHNNGVENLFERMTFNGVSLGIFLYPTSTFRRIGRAKSALSELFVWESSGNRTRDLSNHKLVSTLTT